MDSLIHTFFDPEASGSFSLLNLSLTMANSPGDFNAAAWRSLPEEERIEQWMTSTALFHEIRHYHDLLGTICGFHLLLEATQFVDGFYVTLLKRMPSKMVAPIRRHNPDTALAQMYDRYSEFLKIVLGDIPRERLSASSNLVTWPVRRYASPKLGVSLAYPLIPFTVPDPFSGESETFLTPIGLRSLMEHTAVELQIFLASIGAGEDPDDPMDSEGRARRSHNLWSSLYRSSYYNYVTAHFFASLMLAGVAPKSTVSPVNVIPPMGEVFILAQMAMDYAGYAPIERSRSGYDWQFEHPGLVFGHLMASWSRSIADRGLRTAPNWDVETAALKDADAVSLSVFDHTYSEMMRLYVDGLETRPQSYIPSHLMPSRAQMALIAKLREDLLADHTKCMSVKANNLCSMMLPPGYLRLSDQLPRPRF
jgi:hypothetical protein